MSISNSFSLPVKVVATDASLGHYRVDDSFGMVVAALMKKDEAEAIKLALDSHESLVATNKELASALGQLLKTDYMSFEEKHKYKAVLAKHSQESK